MNITIDFNQFKKALDQVEKLSIQKLKYSQVIENLHIQANDNKVTLTKYNLNTKIQATTKATITEESGTIVIPASTIKIIKNIKNANEIKITDSSITIDKKVVRFKNIDANEYPEINIMSYNEKFQVSQMELLRLLTCNYATDKNDYRPTMDGININNNEFSACNGYIASLRHSNEFNSDINVTMSADTFKLLNKTLNANSKEIVTVYTNECRNEKNDIITKHIRFHFSNIDIEGKLIQGDFINIHKFLPDIKDATTVLSINDKNFQEKLKLFKSLNNDMIVTKVTIDKDTVKISSQDTENTIEDDVKASSIEGKALEIAFNNDYLIATTKQYDQFKMCMTSNVSAAIITKNQQDMELLLPVRIR